MQRGGDDLLAQLAVADADGGGLLRHEAGGRHAGQGVDLQEPRGPVLVQDEVGTGIDRQAQCAVDLQRSGADALLDLGRDLRRADLEGGAGLVLVLVIIEAGLRDDLDGRQRATWISRPET